MKKKKWINLHTAGQSEMLKWMTESLKWLPRASNNDRMRMQSRLLVLRTKERFQQKSTLQVRLKLAWNEAWKAAKGNNDQPLD